MNLGDYLRILRVRWRLLLSCVLAAVALAAIVTLTTTPVYQSRAQLFISTSEGGTVAGAFQSNLLAQQRVATYQEFATSPQVVREIDSSLDLSGTEGSAGKITTVVPPDTPLINFVVEDSQADRAAAIANAAVESVGDLITQIEQPDPGIPSPIQATVVREATPAGAPIRPRPAFNIALGALTGLLLGAAAAVLREGLDTRVKNVAALREVTGVPNLGTLQFDTSAAKSPLIATSNIQRSERAEPFRKLRTNLQFIDVDRRPRSIVMTSAVAGEGKSTTTANLGITLAQLQAPVVLVDADLRRPRLAQYLGIEGAVGLTDVLIGRVPLDEALQAWGPDGMLFLPSGPIPPNPSELLGSQHMAEVLRDLESRGLVLLDAPPLLPVTDAAVLSTVASGALLVVKAGSTRREQVVRSVESLQQVGGHLLGTVLNMVALRGPDSYGHYGYYGYSSDTTPSPVVSGRRARR